jgi:hypothetical protein
MKNNFLFAGAFFCMIFLSVIPASASDWRLELDNSNGDNVFDLWLRVDEGSSINITYYDIGFHYDPTELAFNDYTNNLPDGWEYDYTPGFGGGTGLYYGIQGAGPAFTLTEDYLLGSYTMDISPGAVRDGSSDIWFAASHAECGQVTIDLIVDGDDLESYDFFYDDHFSYGSGLDVGAPVPVPGAVWLMGSGLLGLTGIRRRKKAGNSNHTI